MCVFEIIFLKFQNFPKNSPVEGRKEGAYKVSFDSENWKYVKLCTKALASVSEFL